MRVFCKLSDKESKSLSKILNIPEQLVLQKANSWMIKNNTNESPTKEQLLKYCEEEGSFTPENISSKTEVEVPPIKGVSLYTTDSNSYYEGAKLIGEWSDVTISLADNFNHNDELETAAAAGAKMKSEERTNLAGGKYTKYLEVEKIEGKYVPSTISDAVTMANEIYKQIEERGLPKKNIKLNIAGSSINNLNKDQEYYDKLVKDIINILLEKGITISEIKTGGQTGISEAGIKAAMALNIKSSILATRLYKMRIKLQMGLKRDINDKERFIQRFNPEYKDSDKKGKSKSKKKENGGSNFEVLATFEDTEEEKRLKEEARKIAAGLTIYSQKGGRGANSIWMYFAKEYGVPEESIHLPYADELNTSFEDDWGKLEPAEKDRIEALYIKAMKSLKRSYLSIRNSGERAKTAKLHRLKVTQVENADAVFIIGEVVKPGEKKSVPLYEGDKSKYLNKADHEAINGQDGISAQLAIDMGKPVHVFDIKDNVWKTWDGSKFVEEEAPKLAKSSLLLGRPGDMSKKGFANSIGKEALKGILDVLGNTFNYHIKGAYDRSFQGLNIDELGESRKALQDLAQKYESDTEGLREDTDNPLVRVNLDFSPKTRKYRVEMLARMFSGTIDDLYYEELNTIGNKVNAASKTYSNAKDRKESREVINAACKNFYSFLEYETDLKSSDANIRRKAIIQHVGLDTIFQRMKQDLITYSKSTGESEYNKKELLKIVDNFDMLLQEALEKVQNYENFRVIPFKNTKSDKFDGNVTDTQEKQYFSQLDFEDDETGTRISGNEGWSFKIRFVNPKLTVSEKTKKILYNIPMLDRNGEEVRDDLGNTRYINGDYAYAVLIDSLSDMIDADDFCVEKGKDDYGKIYDFPALEKLKNKYPWVQGVINKLHYTGGQLIGSFFHDFNKCFINYAKMDENGVPLPLNKPIAEDSAFNTVVRNYENAIILSMHTVYGPSGVNEIHRNNAEILKKELNLIDNKLIQEHVDFSFLYNEDGSLNTNSGAYNLAYKFADILHSIGFETDVDYIAKNLESWYYGDKHEFLTLRDEISGILLGITNPKEATVRRNQYFTEDKDYIQHFTPPLRAIAKIVGEVSELDNVMSFRDGKDTRYSYSAPNYILNMIKKIKNNARRDKFFNEEYGYDDFFYDKETDTWKNKWIEDFKNDLDFVERWLEVTEVISMTDVSPTGNVKSVPFTEWSKLQTYDVLLGNYFSIDSKYGKARYNLPIFSDSPVCMFILHKKYCYDSDGKPFQESLTPLFRNVIKQELGRIKKVKARQAAREALSEEELKKNPNLYEIQNYDDKGQEFQFFPELNKLIIDELIATDPSQIGKTFYDVTQEIAKSGNIDNLNEFIDSTVGVIMDRLFNDFLNDLDLDWVKSRFLTWKATKSTLKEAGEFYDKNSPQYEAQQDKYVKMFLEEYFWNSTYATSQMIQLITSDVAYYKNAVDFQKRFKQAYASGNRMNTNSQYGRKIENTLYLTDQYITSSRYDNVKASLERAVKEGRMKEEHKNWILGELKNINVADAQAFRNPYSFRAVLDMMGKWNDDMEESFNRLNNKKWDEKDIAVIWQTIKPFMFTNVRTKDGLGGEIRVPHQNKNSEFLVLAFYDMIAADSVESDFLVGLGDFFEAHPEIDVIQFESAVKCGGQGAIDLGYSKDALSTILDLESEESVEIVEAAKQVLGEDYEDFPSEEIVKAGMDYLLDNGKMTQERYNDILYNSEMSAEEIVEELEKAISMPDAEGNMQYDMDKGIFNSAVVHQLSYKDYMIAQPNPPHLVDIENATAGSQFRNLILANITDPNFSITLKTNTGNISLNKQQTIDLYRGCIVDNLLDGFEEASGIYQDIHSLQKYLFNIIQGNPKYGTDIIEALQIIKVPNPVNPSEKIEIFNLPPDLPTISNQIQELCNSVFKNRVTKQKIKGGACVQVACVGMSRNLNILRDENNNISGAECMLPAWSKKFFAPFLETYVNENGVEYQELNIEEMKKKCPEILKMVGYRIPTENKYSMLPLIVKGFLPHQNGNAIMLPADITLIAGSDFDVDKMFLRIPAFEIGEDGIPKKIEYDLQSLSNKDTIRMTKQQRDNLMIDIEYGVLTSKEGSEQVFRPGNFNTLKRSAKFLRLFNSKELINHVGDEKVSLLEKFILTRNPGISIEEAKRKANNPSYILSLFRDDTISAKEIEKFIDKYGKPINPLLPQTYTYFHNQNMTGSNLIGVYANGSSMHTKAQETNLVIAEGKEFKINGRTLKSMHDIINFEGKYIQDLIAEFKYGSVDNAKEPVLADLGQNMNTADIAIFMIRAGMSLEEVALLFNVCKNHLDLGSFAEKFKYSFNVTITDYFKGIEGDFHIPSATSEDMIRASLIIKNNPELIEVFRIKGKNSEERYLSAINALNISNEDLEGIMVTLYKVYETYSHISYLSRSLNYVNMIMRSDSPTNAISPGFPAAVRQVRTVDAVMLETERRQFPFRSAEINEDGSFSEDSAFETKKEFISNNVVNLAASRQDMRENLMSRRLPILQAFYSLGIELPIYTMEKFFIQGNKDLGLGKENNVGILGEIMMNSQKGNMSEKEINTFYREFMQYLLTSTKLFGEDFDIKRQYYLTVFPKKALKLKREIMELHNNPVVARLKINIRNSGEASNITFNKTSSFSPADKAEIRRNLNSLLYSENPKVVQFAKDLFMYSFYYNGFNFGPNSFGTYFDATFWNMFPEPLNLLRTFKYENRNYRKFYQNFKEQYLANHTDDSTDNIIFTYTSKDTPPEFMANGSVKLRYGDCYNKYNYGVATYIRVNKGNGEFGLYTIDMSSIKKDIISDDLIRYIPCTTFDEYQSVYNANKTVDEMKGVYYNNRKTILAEKRKTIEEMNGRSYLKNRCYTKLC